MIYEFGKFRLDTENEILFENGNRIKIEPKTLTILSFLVTNEKKPFNDNALINALWDEDRIESSNITTHIYNIRKILGEDSKNPKYIYKESKGYSFHATDLTLTNNKEASLSYSLILILAQLSEKIDDNSYPASKSNKFNLWLIRETSYLKYVMIVCGITLVISLFFMFVIKSSYTLSFISLIQFTILFLLYFKASPFLEGLDQKIENPNFWENELNAKERKSTGCKSFEEFKKLAKDAKDMMEHYYDKWRTLLGIWAALYVSFILIGLPDLKLEDLGNIIQNDPFKGKAIIVLNVLNTFFNNWATYAIINCFKVLNSQTKHGKDYRPLSPKNHAWVMLIIGLFTLIELVIIALLLTYQSNVVEDRFNVSNVLQTIKIFDGFSGMAAATAMAIWFARLQSKIMNPPQWFVILLFSYTAIQPFFVLINVGKLGVLIIVAALTFKLLLILYTTYLFQTGRLFFYFLRIRKTYLYIEDEFYEFSNKFVDKKTTEVTNSN